MTSDCPACGTTLRPEAKFCWECGAGIVGDESADPMLGRTLGAYKVVSLLGEGGMGKVYRAEQTSLGRAVCLKTLLPHFVSDPALVRRFQQEARATSQLRHPNIVDVLDYGEAEDALYIVMELVAGKDLAQLLVESGALPVARALDLQIQILSALAEAHGAGIVHRDLKPANVLVTKLRDGSELAKVTDFGIAKLVDKDRTRITATGAICGTPSYMAPEQIRGEELDGRADVYAAGVVLYELITGVEPFAAGSVHEVFQRHLHEAPHAPSHASQRPLPAVLDDIVLKALEKRPERRFGSALDFRRALESVKASLERGAATAVGLGGDHLVRSPPSMPDDPASSRPAASERQGDLASLGRLMPAKLIEHVGDLESLLGAERRNVTVLFGDISEFTALSETLGAERVRTLINRCFDGMVEAVARYDGTVDKFIGDCIMVLFGAPIAHEDDAERAVRCGLDMLAYLERVNETLAERVGMRIGINCGEVVAGGVGGRRRMDYTVIGDVVNVAQRLQSSARVGTIVVSDAIKRLTERSVRFEALEPIAAKGKRDPIAAWVVAGLTEEHTPRSDLLIGRQGETSKLATLVANAHAGRPAAAVVVGDAGMGKTALLESARREALARGMTVASAVAGRLGEVGHLDEVRQLLAIMAGAPASSGVDRILAELARHGLADHAASRLKRVFAGDGNGGSVDSGMDHADGHLLDDAALLAPFLAVAGRQGLCVIVDDLHLAGRGSLAFLDRLLARAGKGLRLGLIASARPGAGDAVLPKVARLDLAPLGDGDVLLVAKGHTGIAELSPEVAELVIAKSAGNPLAAVEVVKMLIDRGELVETRPGTWSGNVDDDTVPDRIAQVVAARMDRLGQAAKSVLRVAAVIGQSFTLELVGAAADGHLDVYGAARECEARGFFVAGAEPRTYELARGMTRDAVLLTLTEADRRQIHLRVAEALERGVRTTTDLVHEALAYHFLAAGRVRSGIHHAIAAGDALVERGALLGAADHYERALELSLRQSEQGARHNDKTALLVLDLAKKLARSIAPSEPQRAATIVPRVLGSLPDNLAHGARADALVEHARVLRELGRMAEARQHIEEALAVAPQGESERVARIHAELAGILEAQGDVPRATTVLVEGFRLIAGSRTEDPHLLWRYLNQMGRLHFRAGQPERAEEFFHNAREHARRAKSLSAEARVLANLGALRASTGDHASGRSLLEEARQLAEKAGDFVGAARTRYNLGRLLATEGRRVDAIAELREAARSASALGWREGLAAAVQTLEAMGEKGFERETGR